MVSSRYLLLVIYAFFNMDNQGWGTREGPKLPAAVDDAKVVIHLDMNDLCYIVIQSKTQ